MLLGANGAALRGWRYESVLGGNSDGLCYGGEDSATRRTGQPLGERGAGGDRRFTFDPSFVAVLRRAMLANTARTSGALRNAARRFES